MKRIVRWLTIVVPLIMVGAFFYFDPTLAIALTKFIGGFIGFTLIVVAILAVGHWAWEIE